MPVLPYKSSPKTTEGAKKIYKILYNHNIAVVNVGTGGGKTYMAIHSIGAWEKTAHFLIITTKKQVESQDWETSINYYNHATGSHLTSYVINYGALDSKKQQLNITKNLIKHVDQPLYIIADEAQNIKNPVGARFKKVRKLMKVVNFKKLICLTATPITESLLDAAAYLIIDGKYRNKTDFYSQHVTRYDKNFQPITKDFQHRIHNEWLKDYKTIIREFKDIQIVVSTKELLPPVTYVEKKFTMTEPEMKEYRKIRKNYINGVYESVGEAISAQNTFVAEHCSKRMTAIKQLVDNPKRPTGPVLIFYQYRADCEMLKENLSKLCPDYQLLELNGQHSADLSTTPPDKTLILCQYQSASEALNAQWSHVTIFYAPTASWKLFKQARGRNVRAHQAGKTYQIRFVVQKTISAHYWYDLIDNKQAFTTDLMENYLLK